MQHVCSWSNFVFVFSFTVSAVDPLTMTTFTLFTEVKLNWQTAVEFCRNQGKELVRITTSEQNDYLASLWAREGSWESFRGSSSYWLSLHRPDSNSAYFVWQLIDAHDCLRLQPGSWSDWFDNKPAMKDGYDCIKVFKNGLWKSENCSESSDSLICMESEGSCTFDKLTGAAVHINDNDAVRTLTLTSLVDGAQCQQKCSSTQVFLLPCAAAEWNATSRSCRLHMLARPLRISDEVIAIPERAQDVFIPYCYSAKIDTSVIPVISSYKFQSTCNNIKDADPDWPRKEDMTSSRLSVEAPREKMAMIFFPSSVSWANANMVCSLLHGQYYLVRPKDALMSRDIGRFLSSQGYQEMIWLGMANGYQRATLAWADGSDAIWPQRSPPPDLTLNCTAARPDVSDGLTWKSRDCNSQKAVFMCQLSLKTNCTFDEVDKFTGMDSDWSTSVGSQEECSSFCNELLFNGSDCLAYLYDYMYNRCFFVHDDGRDVFQDEYSELRHRSCFEYMIYDNASAAINKILYEEEQSTTAGFTDTGLRTVSDTEQEAITISVMESANSSPNTESHPIANNTSLDGNTEPPLITVWISEYSVSNLSLLSTKVETLENSTFATVSNFSIPPGHKEEDSTNSSSTSGTLMLSEFSTGTTQTTEGFSDAAETSSHALQSTSSSEVAEIFLEEQLAMNRRPLCLCSHCKNPPIHATEISPVDEQKLLNNLVNFLTVDKLQTSRNRRKYFSASDSRPTAQAIGSFGIAFLVIALVVIIAIDISSFLCNTLCQSHPRSLNPLSSKGTFP